MPIRFQIDAARGRVHTRAEGAVTLEEIRSYLKELRSDPQFSPTLSRLVDLRGLTRRPSIHLIWEVADEVRVTPGNAQGRRALVASAAGMYVLLRLFCRLTGYGAYRAFRSVDEAERWLDGG